MARGQIDISLTVPNLGDERLRRNLLFSERYVCVARREHPLADGPVSLEDYCQQAHLIVSPSRGSFSGVTDDVLTGYGVSRDV